MNYDLSDLKNLVYFLYSDEYYKRIDLERDLTLNRVNLAKYLTEYRTLNSGGNTNNIPNTLKDRLSPIVKDSQVRKYIQLQIVENIYRDFSKHLSSTYKRNFKEREAYLLAQSLAPALSKNFLLQNAPNSEKKYVFGLSGLQREFAAKGKVYEIAIEKQLETLYTKGYMYALDENLNPIIKNNRVQILEDRKGQGIKVAPLADKNFKFHHFWEFVNDNSAHRKRKRSRVFSIPSSWKIMAEWERTIAVTRTPSLSQQSQWSAEISKEKNPLVSRIVSENTHSYMGALSSLINVKKSDRIFAPDSLSAIGVRRSNRYLFNERKYNQSRLFGNFSGEKNFSDNFEYTFGKRLESIGSVPGVSTNPIQSIKRKLNSSKISKRLRGVGSISAEKKRAKRKKRRILKFLDYIVAIPGLIVVVARYFIDKTLFNLARYVGEKQGITYSLLRNVAGEGMSGRVLTFLDGTRFSFGVLKLIAKDGVEALVPALLTGLTLSSPLAGAIFGGIFFASKFFVDFSKYFSLQNPMVTNIIERISATMTDRALSLPEILFKSGTFGVTAGVIGTGIAAIFGVSGLPLIFTGVGILTATSVVRAIDLAVVGRDFASYSTALESGGNLFKSQYLIEIGGPFGGIGFGLFFATGNPLFLGLAGVGLVSAGVADFFKASLFEDSVLHDISSFSIYDATHTIGFAGGGALIGFALGGSLGPLVALITGGVFAGGSLYVTIVQKVGSRFIVHPNPLWERVDLSPDRINYLRSLSREDLYREFANSGYTSDILDKVYGERGIYEYLHDTATIPDPHYIEEELRSIREDTLLYRQELLRGYNPDAAFVFYKDGIDRMNSIVEGAHNFQVEFHEDIGTYLRGIKTSGGSLDDAISRIGLRNVDIRDYLDRVRSLGGNLDDAIRNIDLYKNLSNVGLEDFLKGLSQEGRVLNPLLIDSLSKDSDIQKLYDEYRIHPERLNDFLKEVYREDIRDISNFNKTQLAKLEDSRGIKDGSHFGVKYASREMHSFYRISEILKNPTMDHFVNSGILRKELLDHFGANGEAALYDELLHTPDVWRFLESKGLDISLRYDEFATRLEDINVTGLSDFNLGLAFKQSEFFKFLDNTHLAIGDIFPNLEGLSAIEKTTSIRDLFISNPARFADIFNSEFLSSNLNGIELRRVILDSLSKAGAGSLGKVSAMIQMKMFKTLGLTTEDIATSINSGMLGGAILSVIFGVTSPIAFTALTLGYFSFKTGLTILSKIEPKVGFLGNIISKETVAKASEFLGNAITPGLLGFVIGSYFLGPIGGALVGASTGIGWAILKSFRSVGFFEGKIAGFMNFMGEHILNPLYLIYFDTQLVSANFWEGLFFRHGLMGFVPSVINLAMGVMSTVGLAAGLASIGGFVLGALPFLAAIPEVLVGFVVVAGAVVVTNWLVSHIFGYDIFHYVGEFAKNAFTTVAGWFGHHIANAIGFASIGLDILIGIIALFFKSEFDIDDFLRTIFIMVFSWALFASVIGGGTSSGGNNNNTSNTVNHNATPATSFLNTSGKIINIENNPGSVTADTIFVKTSSGVIKVNTTNPYLYKGESVYKGEYLGE